MLKHLWHAVKKMSYAEMIEFSDLESQICKLAAKYAGMGNTKAALKISESYMILRNAEQLIK